MALAPRFAGGGKEGMRMANIKITMKDGTIKDFPDRGRPGGSYCNSLRYEGVFAIVKDVWGAETAVPAADIAEIKKDSDDRGRW